MSEIIGFGIRELWVAPIVSDDEAGTVYGTLRRLKGVSELGVEPEASEYVLEG